jgi:hypothetical protein
MTANKFLAEVDAPEFGEGFTIRLDMDGAARLETDFGEFDFVQKVQFGLAVLSAKYIRAFLAVSLRDADGAIPKTFDVPLPLDAVAKKCLDAFALFRYGKDHETWTADNAKKLAEKAPKENPTKGTKA